jgi:hypothetical protein
MSNNDDSGRDAFQTFFHNCNGVCEPPLDEGVIPSKSIFISPSTSIDIGWERVDAGTGIGLLNSRYLCQLRCLFIVRQVLTKATAYKSRINYHVHLISRAAFAHNQEI